MDGKGTFRMVIRENARNGSLEVDPTFSKNAVVFHPLPSSLNKYFKVGDTVEGTMGIERPTGRADKRGVPIYTAFFIPSQYAKGAQHGKE